MSDEPVTIAKFLTLGEAKLAQGKLISAGISAFVCDENMHAMNWHIGMALGGIRLQVPDSQMVRALEVLDDFEPEGRDVSQRRKATTRKNGRGRLLSGMRITGDSRNSGRKSAPDRFMVGSHSIPRARGTGDRTAGNAWLAGISGGRRKSRLSAAAKRRE